MFYILDGSGYLFRSYYALPELKNKNGEDVSVVFGFFRMLLKILHDKPDKFVIAWDSKTKTFRHEQFEQYKANRPKMPNEFKNQVQTIQDIVQRLQIPFLIANGYEADDIIYTIVKNYDGKISIVSSDKDLKQLLSEKVVFLDPVKQQTRTYQDFQQQMGFSCPNIVDYLALVGDSSDNIPGVKGIGQKTASDLIQKYGNIENIYENIDDFSGALKQKLIEGKDLALKSKSLVQLASVPDISTKDIGKISIDFERLKNILVDEFGFKSMEKSINDLKKSYNSAKQASLF